MVVLADALHGGDPHINQTAEQLGAWLSVDDNGALKRKTKCLDDACHDDEGAHAEGMEG